MLNPNLFALLEHRFGKGNVRVHNRDHEMVCRYVADPMQVGEGCRYRLAIDTPGEEYLVKCPFCKDWKHRLYINHRWGVYDPQTSTRNLWLAHCWNEPCLSTYDRQKLLYEQVVEFFNAGSFAAYAEGPQVVRSDRTLAITQSTKSVDIPGALWQLDHMKRSSPRHVAVRYVEDRLWDPVQLGLRYKVSYCIDAYNPEVKGRIVAPVYMREKLVGWQARYVGDTPKGKAKWYTCPGMRVGSCLYNYDRMCQQQTKVIVEGPADVWSFGPQAAGIFNKVMTKEQRQLLVNCFNEGDVVVILLDPEQDPKSKARGEQHHIEKLFAELQSEPKLRGRVVKMYLPHGCDPDELDREYMRSLISEQAHKQGLITTFKKVNNNDAVTVRAQSA